MSEPLQDVFAGQMRPEPLQADEDKGHPGCQHIFEGLKQPSGPLDEREADLLSQPGFDILRPSVRLVLETLQSLL